MFKISSCSQDTVASRVVERSHPVGAHIVHLHLVLRVQQGLHQGKVTVSAGVVQGRVFLGVQAVQHSQVLLGRQQVVLQLLQVAIAGNLLQTVVATFSDQTWCPVIVFIIKFPTLQVSVSSIIVVAVVFHLHDIVKLV